MRNDILRLVKVLLLVLIVVLLIYLVYLFQTHLNEIKDTLHAIKGYMKENPVDTFPLIP